MSKKFQSYTKPGLGRTTELPPNAKADNLSIFRYGNFEPNDLIQGEITIVGGHPATKFTGIVSTVNSDGRIETFRTTSPDSTTIPELSGEVSLASFDYYLITSVDET